MQVRKSGLSRKSFGRILVERFIFLGRSVLNFFSGRVFFCCIYSLFGILVFSFPPCFLDCVCFLFLLLCCFLVFSKSSICVFRFDKNPWCLLSIFFCSLCNLLCFVHKPCVFFKKMLTRASTTWMLWDA